MSLNPPHPRRRVALAALALITVVLAAGCSSDGGSSATSAPTSTVSGNVVQLSGANPDALGGDLTIKVGLDVALSGQGAYFGKTMVDGAQLAADQIRAAGGPDFQLEIKDHKSGDSQAGVQTTRELGQDDVHFALYSYIGVLGSAFQGIEQYKILSLDGGGGTQKFGQGKPFFYGTRAQPPNDTYPGIAEYLAAAMPDVKTAAMIIGDSGPDNVADSTGIARESLAAKGITLGDVEVVPYGATDVSSAVTKLTSGSPDVILTAQFGSDTGYFLKQLRGAGSQTPVIGAEYIPDTADIAGSAANGFMFSADYFDAQNPQNDWGKYFVDTWTEAHPGGPTADYYAANYYEDMFTIWQTVQRIVKNGGDVENPDDILAAFTSDLTFPSVYGQGDGQPYGTYTIDPDTHTLSSRDMGVFRYDGGTIQQLAAFQIGGAGFSLTQ